ncbi:hypothetical protein AB1Y20_008624 [Prymnesium parvum]|uniref:Uncharacterized protein n=1 Tax=Prymnesium parvum TaxID=97485 RepID=A0AB34ITX7_PRYPA
MGNGRMSQNSMTRLLPPRCGKERLATREGGSRSGVAGREGEVNEIEVHVNCVRCERATMDQLDDDDSATESDARSASYRSATCAAETGREERLASQATVW